MKVVAEMRVLVSDCLTGTSLDVMAVAPHPDDAELGVGGILALAGDKGLSAGILDLTAGELSTNGTPEERLEESIQAAELLALSWRANLGLPDGGVTDSEEQVRSLAQVLRHLRPKLLLLPHRRDRHPDHARSADLGERAAFAAGLKQSDLSGSPHTVGLVAYYCINEFLEPDLVVDVSVVHRKKRQALSAHASQFDPRGRRETVLNHPSFLRMIYSRDGMLGSAKGVAFAEGLSLREPPLVEDLGFLTRTAPERKGD